MIVDCGVYREGRRIASPPDVTSVLDVLDVLAEQPDAFCWLGLHEPSPSEMSEIANAFGLHELAVEDALEAHQRPKLERYDSALFVVLKTMWYVDERDAVETGEVNVFVGANYVVTVRHGVGFPLAQTRADLESRASTLGHGPAAVLYAVCDRVVDEYGEIVQDLAVDVDEVEESVFSPERTSDAQRVYRLKRQVVDFKRAVQPLTTPMDRFARAAVAGIDASTAPFFRDVADHLVRVSEHIDALDDLLSSVLAAHLARVGVQQNEDMRKISAYVAMAAVPTAIAGIYGMNFDYMPELHWVFGYPAVMLLMAAIVGGLFVLFKRSGWL